MTLGIGISVASAHPGADGRTAATEMIRRVRAAREAGLDSLSLGDHHATAATYMQNAPMLGRLLAEWGTDKPAGCLFLLPLWHPVLVAEQVATLACLASEPFIVQTGVGHGAGQFAGMGADLSARGAITDEWIGVIDRLLSGESVDVPRLGVTGAAISPAAPGPVEWWVGAASRPGIERAARVGAAWYAGPALTPTGAATQIAMWHEACGRWGRPPGRAVLRRDVLVTTDGERARRAGESLVDAGYRGFEAGAAVYGSPTDVAEAFDAYAEMGFTDVVVRAMAADGDLAVESIETMAEVRRALGR